MVGIYDVSKWGKGHSRRPSLQDRSVKKLNIQVISDGITRLPILEGEISHIELPRGGSSLGLTIVGGADTPLRCVVVQEVFPDGLVALDGRLQPGDQIIEVDGADMTTATHQQVCDSLRKSSSVIKLGVYRERIEAYKSSPGTSSLSSSSDVQSNGSFGNFPGNIVNEGVIYIPSSQRYLCNEETINIPLQRQSGRHLGIKLGGRRTEPGVYIVDLMPGSIAERDGRLQPHDRILFINGEDVRYGRVEFASQLIHRSRDFVNLIITRSNRPSPRERLHSLSQDSLFGGSSSTSDQASECSVVDEEQMVFSDNASDQSRQASPTSESSRNGEIHPSNGTPNDSSDSDVRIFESFKSSRDIFKQSQWPTINTNSSKKGNPLATPLGSFSNSYPRGYGWSREEEIVVHQKAVHLTKGLHEGLGMRIGGGVNSNEGDTPIYVANINNQGPAGKSKKIKKGDVVLSVNSNSLLGLTHSQAVSMLKATAQLTQVTLTLLDGPETCGGPSNFVPSWLYWQKLPRALHISKGVVLHRSPGTSLGFSIVGGCDPQRGSEPIHVLFVVATSPAAIDGRLRCGDRLLAVDGQCLEGLSHAMAVCLLKQAGHRVTLEIVSWMGTEL